MEVVAVGYRRSIHAQHDVALLQAGPLRRTVGAHIAHQRAAHFFLTESLGDRRRDVLRHDPQIRTRDFAVLHDLLHDAARHIRRDREADTLIAFRTVRDDRRVDADQLAAVVHQRPARIARVDGRVGLDEVLILLDPHVGPAGSAHDSHRHRPGPRQTDRRSPAHSRQPPPSRSWPR